MCRISVLYIVRKQGSDSDFLTGMQTIEDRQLSYEVATFVLDHGSGLVSDAAPNDNAWAWVSLIVPSVWTALRFDLLLLVSLQIRFV